MARVTAVFDDRVRAERGVNDLRRLGVQDCDLMFVAGSEDEAFAGGAREGRRGRAVQGARVGGSAGLLFGLGALTIPGVGPFITAGGLATALSTSGEALESGAIVGGTLGTIAAALARAGYGLEESEFCGPVVERGGVLVALETVGLLSEDEAREILTASGGRAYRH